MIRIRVGVCLLDEDRLLLVEHLKSGRHHWLLPGGGVEHGETLVEAGRRELLEETGLSVDVGRLLIVAESIQPEFIQPGSMQPGSNRPGSIQPDSADGTRHLLNLVFAGRVTGGTLRPGLDGRLIDAAWHEVATITSLPMHPPIAAAVLACCRERLQGPVRVLGNVWRGEPEPGGV